jgi:hypothetical protein
MSELIVQKGSHILGINCDGLSDILSDDFSWVAICFIVQVSEAFEGVCIYLWFGGMLAWL